eukprot:gene6038-6276_t
MHTFARSGSAVLLVLLLLVLCSTLPHPAQATSRHLQQAQPESSDPPGASDAFSTAPADKESNDSATAATGMGNKTLSSDDRINRTIASSAPASVVNTSPNKDSNQTSSGNNYAVPSDQAAPVEGNNFTITLANNNITILPQSRSPPGTTGTGNTTAILVLPVTIRSNTAGNR